VRERIPVIVVTIAAVAITVMLVLWVRTPGPEPPAATEPVNEVAEGSYSGRAEKRLELLRESYSRREAARQAAERGAAGGRLASSADQRPETTGPDQRQKVAPAAPDAAAAQRVAQAEHTILNSPQREKRRQAIAELADQAHTGNDDEAVRILLGALGDRDAQVRAAAVEALGEYIELVTPDMLVPVLKDGDPRVRLEAVTLLGMLDQADAQPVVQTMVNDPDEQVRDLAEEVLDLFENPPTPFPDVQRRINRRKWWKMRG
jgi:hypothetical protein